MTRRYNDGRPIVLTANKPFAEWPEMFPNAEYGVTLVDRLIHCSEILTMEGESYGLREARQRSAERQNKRRSKRSRSTKASQGKRS